MEKPLTELNSKEIEIIISILNSGIVHYSDIGKNIGRSKKTITKYLNEIETVLTQYNINLVRKRNVGIYFDGDTAKLNKDIHSSGYYGLPKNKDERITLILSKLLLSEKNQTVQGLADLAFVSRGTLENDLKEVKRILAKHDAFLQTTSIGIQVVASESSKRKLISDLITMYWGKTLYSKNDKGELNSKLQLPTDITQYFKKDIFKKVMMALDEFDETSSLELTDYEYQSLAIHLIIALERISENESLDTGDSDVELEGNTETLVEILEKTFDFEIPKYEKQYINIHILAAEGQLAQNQKIQESKNDFQQQVIHNFLTSNIDDYDNLLINGLTLHLSSALKRLFLGLNLHNPYKEQIKKNFPQAFNEALELCSNMEKQFNVSMNEDEVAYVALHIEAFLERPKDMVTAVIVCSTGLGTARLLNQRIKKFFSNSIKVLRVTSIQELKHNSIKEDLIISTINFDVPNKNVVIVPPFLDNNSVDRIKSAVDKILNKDSKPNSFINLLFKDLVFINDKTETRNQVIKKIGKQIIDIGYGNKGIDNAAIKRENLASTAMDNLAMPHAPVEFVNKPFIAIYVNKRGIDWNGQKVNIVFFLAMNKQVHDEIDNIYKYFNNVLEDKSLLKKIVNSTDSEQILRLLSGEFNE